jgi:hypothetical protein
MSTDNIQVIGTRSSILIKDNVFSLVILPTEDKKKTNWLFLWLFAWTVSGMIVMMSYFKLTITNQKLMIIVWLGFWAYFEYKIIKVFMWKRFGKEKLWIKNGILHYQQNINGRGKIVEYNANLIADLQLIELVEGSIVDTFNQTFWVKGGERIQFTTQGKDVKFAMQLTDDEAKKVVQALKKKI